MPDLPALIVMAVKGLGVDCAFTSSLYYRWMFGKVYFIVFSILYHFVCGCKGMYQEARE